nr:hypothetical protein CFP56_09364 [Quercus suber]
MILLQRTEVFLGLELNECHVLYWSAERVCADRHVRLEKLLGGQYLSKVPRDLASSRDDCSVTAAAHKVKGYYCTGDVVCRKDEYYFMQGQVSIGSTKSGGYKTCAPGKE